MSKKIERLEDQSKTLLEKYDKNRERLDHLDISDELSKQYLMVKELLETLSSLFESVNRLKQDMASKSERLIQQTKTTIEEMESLYQSREEEIIRIFSNKYQQKEQQREIQNQIIQDRLGDSISGWIKKRNSASSDFSAVSEAPSNTTELLLQLTQEFRDIEDLDLTDRQQEILKRLQQSCSKKDGNLVKKLD